MKELSIGGVRYQLVAAQKDGRWTARAERVDGGDRFGIEPAGATESEALQRLTLWLEWQAEHTSALEALQHAERSYHRTIAGSAFTNPSEGPDALEIQKESLEVVEAARTRLDEVRSRRPE
jgi:hypothetical protein